MKFVDRDKEMMTLKSEYEREGSSLVILYGRRRVGKTTLIKEFIKDKKAIFFLASEESELQNRNQFKEKVCEFLNNDLLKDAEVKNWDILFRMISEASFESKPIIVLDEFQYLGKANSAFPSILQRIWEEYLKNKSIMLILCGSLVSMMISQTLSYDSPLYGRRTSQIKLKQIPFKYYHQFFNCKDRLTLIEKYSVTGGVPKYIELFLDDRDIYQSIQESILNQSSYLYDEPHFLLQQEVSEVGSYFSIIKCIAAGNQKLSSISSTLQIKATSLTKYLKTLIDLDILEREIPITENNPEKSKKGLYKIKDNYLRFWFLFIYPNISFIESGHSDYVNIKIKNELINKHTSFVYEDICKETMWELNMSETWPFHFSKVGRWWDAHDEIDIVALDEQENNIILGECKYWKEQVGINVLKSLEKKSEKVEWNKENRTVWYILFSAHGFTPELIELSKNRSDLILIDEQNM